MLPMRKAIISLCVLLNACTTVNMHEDVAYIIVDALVTEENARQPTWIAFYANKITRHLATGESILTIRPGRYKLSHVDFQNSIHSNRGTVIARGRHVTWLKPPHSHNDIQ